MNELDLERSVPYQFSYSSNEYSVECLCDHLYNSISHNLDIQIPKLKLHRIREHIKSIACNLLIISWSQKTKWIAYSRSENFYKINRYNKTHCRRYMCAIIDSLVEKGFAINKKGFKDKILRRSRMKPSEKFYELMSQTKCSSSDITRSKSSELIMLKDKYKKKIDYTDNNKTISMRRNLEKYNAFINKANITHPKDPCKRRSLCRIFNNSSWKLGGRFYYSIFMEMSSGKNPHEGDSRHRCDIQINGNPVVELDYSELHPTILYSKTGNNVVKEPYFLDNYERYIIKKSFNCMVNAKDYISALKCIQKEYRHMQIDVPDLFRKICDKHSLIKHYFYTGIGLELQYADSCIAEKILMHFTKKKIPILSIHDSFVIEERYKFYLLSTMTKLFEDEFGIKPEIKEIRKGFQTVITEKRAA